jgi:hypothetical protein
MQNAMAPVPKIAMRAEVAGDLRRVFDADEPAEAERRLRDVVGRYQKAALQLAAWLQEKSVLFNTPGWTRTSDPGIRNPMLYPPELRARKGFLRSPGACC